MLPLVGALLLAPVLSPTAHPLLRGSQRQEREGWIYVRLQGTPKQLGFQHGYWLAPEIKDQMDLIGLQTKQAGKDPATEWKLARVTARRLIWKWCNQDERDELEGIAEGMQARGYRVDVDDIVAYNGSIELGYFTDWLSGQVPSPQLPHPPERCSAFAATGNATKDGKVVIGHSCWTDYLSGERDNVILDIHPNRGYRILMDAFPGWIHSGDDFGINAQGIAMTETTISGYRGYDEKGIPEFLRMRRAIQYGKSIDDVRRIMQTGNNGSYANMWLIADAKTNEIAKLELGLKAAAFHRTKDGAYGSANFPEDPEIVKECPGFPEGSNACSDRRKRWDVLLTQQHGKIDVEMGKAFLGDHKDEVTGNAAPSFSSLCGHGENETRPSHGGPDGLVGAVQGKVADGAGILSMAFWARMGHPCGADFLAKPYLEQHPANAWMAPMLKDMKGHAWAQFKSR